MRQHAEEAHLGTLTGAARLRLPLSPSPQRARMEEEQRTTTVGPFAPPEYGGMNQRPRRVGIHGVRSAGKTCFLGSLYGFRSTDALKLDVADDASCRYLSAVWKELSEGR